MKKIISILLVAVMSLSLVACSPSKSTTDTANTNDTGKTENTDNSGKKTVYFLTKILGNQYWSVVEQGAKDAAAELGINLVVTGLANEAEIEKQVQQLQDAVSAKADAIVLGPVDSTAMVNPVNDAFNSGIPIIVVDTMINTDNYSAALMTNNVEAGKIAAEEMINRMKAAGVSETEKAQIAVQIGSSGSQTIIDRLKGFNEYWDANAPEAWEVLNNDIKVNDGDITKAVGFTQDFLTAYPDLKGVFGPNNGSTVGFVTGLKESGRKDVVMVGFDFSAEIEQMIREGEFEVATVLQKQYLMGYEGVKTAIALSEGKQPEEKLIDTGVMVVDKENVDATDVQEIINPSGK
ncbi:ABC transporter substrate-binding protein [Anaerocolumna sp.]|uniref:ABC transporter substrate-binding protein n=1 Tax=Anaerocolumna sp. TaxID=2041569 RepID=UPI0028AEF6AC|nr:ABC transporter substrate-binding protein [Anaerocolumna sp.]